MGRTTIPWARPSLGEQELEHLRECFAANWLSMGPKVKAFEAGMAEYVGADHAVAVSNGTVALDMAMKTLGIGSGDEVIVPAITYIATAFAVLYQHAVPVFADIDEHGNLEAAAVEALVSERSRAIIFIDYGGGAAAFDALRKVADSYGLHLIQDAAQSLGGRCDGEPLGAQTEISTMSFHTAKVMTTVEGGMVFTQNGDFAEVLRSMRNQGEAPGRKYIHHILGMNARMTDMQAGIGLSQLDRVEYFIRRRIEIAERYHTQFADVRQVRTPNREGHDFRHAYFFYAIRVPGRDDVARRLRDECGIDTRIAYPLPVYEQELFASGRYASRHADCPNAQRFAAEVLNLPIFPEMTDQQVDAVASAVLHLLRQR